MKKRMLIILSCLLFSSCSLGITLSSSNTTTSSSIITNSVNSKEETTKYKFELEAYYDYEIHKKLQSSISMNQPETPYLLYSNGEESTGSILNINLNNYGIKNVIGGDKIVFYSTEQYLNLDFSFPSVITIPNDVKEIDIIETPVYIFEVQRNEFNEQFLYCLDNDISYLMTNRIITNHQNLYLADQNQIYDKMRLYGTLTDNNEIDTLFTYNPRIDEKENFDIIENEIFTFIEQTNTSGTFINNNHLITTDISEYNDLIIGNEYLITMKYPISLIKNLYDVQCLVKPSSIELSKEFIVDQTIDIKIYCRVDAYDGMPRYDEEKDTVDSSLRFWYSKYDYVYMNFEEPLSFKDICESTTLESSLYFDYRHIEIYDSYIGFDFIDNDNKKIHLINKEEILKEDIILFINQESIVSYM